MEPKEEWEDKKSEKKSTLETTSCVSSTQYDSTSDEEWRNIIFLPFDRRWESLIVIFVLINSVRVIYEIFFGHIVSNVIYAVRISEVTYTVDTILAILHRNMKRHSKKRKFKQKNLLYISVDVITLLPFFTIYSLIIETSHYEVDVYYRDVARAQVLPRLYRVIVYFNKMRNTAGLNQLLIVCLYLTIRIFFIALGIACVYYLFHGGTAGNTVLNQKNIKYGFETGTVFEVFLATFLTSVSVFLHATTGLLGVRSTHDVVLIIISNFFGYFFTIMIAYGELTSVFVKKLMRHFHFTWRFHLVERYMYEWELSQEIKEKIVTFYHDFWKRRRGIMKLPKVINLLPINLHKEILLDLSWDALKHSHLFHGEDMAFKKVLSLHMKYQYYLPGDVIFRSGDVRAHMIYINSGIVQVLSDEDEESPILSFSNGTLLGESCCLMFHQTKAILKCATSCEIQTLSFTNFYKTLLLFPQKAAHFRATYRNRLHNASTGLKIINRHMELKKYSLVLPETTIKSLKRRWRLIASLQKDTRKNVNLTDFGCIDGVHTSEFLNTLVLIDDVDLKLKAIFLTKHFPFILDPDSDVATCWQYITLLMIVCMDFLLPLYTCFNYETTHVSTIIILLDMMYIMDLFVQISTAIKLKQQTITKMRDIALQRVSQLSFIVDIVTALPLDHYLSHFTDVSYNAIRYMKLIRLLKSYRIFSFLYNVQDSNWHSPMLSRTVKFICIALLGIYFGSAITYSIKCGYYGHCDYLKSYPSPPSAYLFDRLTLPIFSITSYIVGICVNNYNEISLWTFVVSHVFMFFGFMFLNVCFSEVCALFVLKKKHENEYKDEMGLLRSYLVYLNLPRTVFRKLQEYLIFTWQCNRNSKMLGKDSVMNELPKVLEEKVLKKTVVDTLKRLPIFAGLSDRFFTKIYKHTALYSVPPDTNLVSGNTESRYLRVILRGYCKMYSIVPIDNAYKRTRVLSPGEAFPVMELFHKVQTFIKVVTITAVDVFYISDVDLRHALQYEYVETYTIQEALRFHMAENEKILMKRPGRLPELLPDEKSYGRGEFFTYSMADDAMAETTLVAKMDEVEKQSEWKLGRFGKILKFVMLKRTIHPQSRIYMSWEIVTCIITFFWVIINLTTYNVYGAVELHFDRSGMIGLVMHIILVFDMYVRFHIQYYNKKGILVTHHYCTAKHYLKTSLFADILILMPYKALQLTKVFGSNRMYLTDVCISVFFRSLRLYHVFGLLSYYQVDSSKKLSTLINITKIFIVIIVTLFLFTNIYLLATCNFDPDLILYTCPEDSWLKTTFDPDIKFATRTFTWALFVVVTAFTTAVTGSFQLTAPNDVICFMFMLIYGVFLRTYFVAFITSSGISGYSSLNLYQQRISVFLKFVKDEAVDEELIKETINYYEYLFRKTKGKNFRTFAESFFLSLCITFSWTVFATTLQKVQLFRNIDFSFLRAVSNCCELTYYKKDTPIIRCNDVQDNLYIVHKGTVSIIVAGQTVCTLNRGGLFGNFDRRIIRQTITAVSTVHTELLAVNCINFYKLLNRYKNLASRIKQAHEFGCEFWESDTAEDSGDVVAGQQSAVQVYSSEPQSMTSSKVQARSLNLLRYLTRTIDHTSNGYEGWLQFINFHVSAITSVVYAYCIFMAPLELKLAFRIYKIIVDVLYLANFYMGFRATYTDPESGITITDSRMIAKRYLKSYFILDFITVCPLSYFYMASSYDELRSYRLERYLSCNKLLRMLYVIIYYEKIRYKLKDMTVMRFCYLIYLLAFVIQCLASLWYVSWCWGYKCSLFSINEDGDEIAVDIKQPFFSNLMSYYYIMNIFTQSSLTSIRSTNYKQLFISIFLILFLQYVSVVLTKSVASYLVNKYSTMNSYEFAIQELREYLKSRELSPSILNKTWQYLLDLWFRRNGQQLPKIIENSPAYLKQDLMYAMYGKHLENHFLFSNTHVDFIRQLVCALKPCMFFPNNYIVEKHDVDSTMYFVHSGEVEAIEVMGKNSFLHNVLTKNMSFGEAQGLFNVPHVYSYKAVTVCDVLLLRRSDWDVLLNCFPASKQQIYARATEHLPHTPLAASKGYNFTYDMNFTF